MAELTEEQKIIIGVCVGVAAVILIAIIIFICCTFYGKDRKRERREVDSEMTRRYYHQERMPDLDYEKRPYTVYDERPPPYEKRIYEYPPAPMLEPLPPPEPIRREVIVNRPRYHDYERYSEPVYERRIRTKEEPIKRYDDGPSYKTEPIVIPYNEPEYVYNGPPRREQETIYLNQKPQERRYNDDQALLGRTNVVRRSLVPLRRSRSVVDVRRNQPYVGEWDRRPYDMNDFNEGAMRAGRDPFLWKSGRY